MEASIIIPTKERGEVFEKALQSIIVASRGHNVEIIVINDSKKSTPSIRPGHENVRLVNNPKNGVASARNLGASLAESGIVIFMDDDMIVSKAALEKALEVSSQDSKKIHLFNWTYPPELQEELKKTQFGRYLIKNDLVTLKGWLNGEWSEDEVFELTGGISQFLTMRKSVFNEIGGYNEDFPHSGAEDYDFIQRAKKHGVRFYLDKSCMIYHNESDRLRSNNWMERKRRNGETLKVGVRLGYTELALRYSWQKRILLKIVSKFRNVFIFLQKLIPNNHLFDPLYFKLTNVVLVSSIFDGYTRNE